MATEPESSRAAIAADFLRRYTRCPLTVFGLGSLTMMAAAPTALAQFESYPIAAPARSMVTADFNIDGHQDVAIASAGGLEILINAGDGTFLPPVNHGSVGTRIETADLNRDHAFDLVQSSGSSFIVQLNRGDGTFHDAISYNAGRPIRGLALGDIDSDGWHDVAVLTEGSWSESLEWYRNDGMGGFTRARTVRVGEANRAYKLVTGDFDNDGDADFAATTRWDYYGPYSEYQFGVHILLNSESGMNWSVQELNLGERQGDLHDMEIGDLDNDGDFDLVCQNEIYEEDAAATILINHGAGVFGRGGSVFSLGSPTDEGRIAFSDVDGDGDLDMLSAMLEGWNEVTKIRVYLQETRLKFSRELFLPFSFDLEIRGADYTDINGDGLPDMLLTSNVPEPALLVRINERVDNRPILDFDPLVRGARSEFRVSNLSPGASVHFVYSLQPPGSSLGIPQLGGAILDVTEPILHLARARADGDGVARVKKWIYRTAPPLSVTFQAFEWRPGARAAKSNFATAPIVDK